MAKKPSNSEAAHGARLYNTSEFIGVVVVVSALALQLQFPLHIRPSKKTTLINIAGILFIGGGIAVIGLVVVEMNQFQQPRYPGIPTTQLIQTGPYKWSRHPMYAAIVFLIVPGTGLLWNNPWVFVLLPFTRAAFYYGMIRHEEVYLNHKFQKEWKDYCSKTPRWI